MIRLRSQKLLSGVSGLAVLASFGLVSPAFAAATFSGPATYDPIVNDQTDTVVIDLDATVRADAGNNNSWFNGKSMTGAGIKLNVSDSFLLGDIENTLTMLSTDNDAILIDLDSQIGGRIFNSGLIEGGEGSGIVIRDDSTVGLGILNAAGGTITGTADGINLGDDSEIFGGIANTGVISGGDVGVDFDDAEVEFFGGITNNAGGTITGLNAGIEWDGTIYSGGVSNFGTISATGATGNGIEINVGVFGGDITNQTTGTIGGFGASGAAINITGGTLTDDIVNSGLITGGAYGIVMTDGTLSGEIQNNANAIISATGATDTAIYLNGGTIVGGIDNSGSIVSDATNGIAINLNTGVFSGGIENTATGWISAYNTAVLIALPTFTGDFTNAGTIISAFEDGVQINASVSFVGNFVNSGYIEGSSNGVQISTPLFNGNFTNNGGTIIAITGTGVGISSAAFNGDFANSGLIQGTNFGVALTGAAFNGEVTNSGSIVATNRDALRVDGATTVSGTITNAASGVIQSDGEDGIDINGIVTGLLDNQGSIVGASTGIDIDGEVQDDIFTSGVIIGFSDAGIDLSGANAAHAITQTDGLIQGGEGGTGTLNDAINMSNGAFVDTFNAEGGGVDGNIVGGATRDDMFMGATGGTFAWFRGKGSQLDEFDVVAGTAVLGAQFRGATGDEGIGVTVNDAVSMDVDGRAYLDDDTTINLTGALNQGGEGILEWLLTSNTTNYGVINVGTTATLDGLGAVFIDAVDFADQANVIPSDTPFTYNDVLTSTTLASLFTNAGTLLSSSIFFTAEAIDDGSDNVDIVLTRLNFMDALNAVGAAETFNQNSVGGALEDIYTGGEYGTQFEDLFAFLFDAATTPEDVQAAFDEISGSEHAQLQGVALRSSQAFNDSLGMRLDGTLPSSLGLMADLGGRQYAQAAISASDAGAGGAGGSHGLTRGASGVSVWVRGAGQWADVDGDPEASGYDQDTTGISGGVDVAVSNNATLGLAGAWSNDDVDFDTAGDTAEIDSWHIGGYGSVGFGRYYVDGLVSYSSHDTDTTRTISPPVPGAPFTALANYDSTTWTVNGELGMVWRLGRVNVQPSAGLAYMNLGVDGFTETGNANAYQLIVADADADSLASTLAIRASGQWMMGRTPVVPELRVGWRHEFESDPRSFTAVFNELNSPVFTIISSEVQEDSAVVRAGLTAGLTRNFEVFLNVNGQYSSDAAATNASGGLRVTW